MTFLELHNKVLDRLREKRIVSTDIGSTPYINSLSAHINDAKHTVEQAWNWGALRGEDTITMVAGQETYAIPDSADRHYLISRVSVDDTGVFLRNKTQAEVQNYYVSDSVNTIPNGDVTAWAFYYPDAATGNEQIRVMSRPADAYTLRIYRSKHQDELENHDDVLLVPSLPVYSLATALASRERGEVGGTPTSELFALADSHLSDAISLDTAKYPEEQVWFNAMNEVETNIRYQ